MLTTLWNFIILFLWNLPWLAIAIAAGIAFGKHGKSTTTAIQALGALGMFLLAFVSAAVTWLLNKTGAPQNAFNAAYYIFQFLLFTSLVLFAAAFCWEKFTHWRAKPAPAAPIK